MKPTATGESAQKESGKRVPGIAALQMGDERDA